jgi:hypothetical protein
MSPITRTVTLLPFESKVVVTPWTPQVSGRQCVRAWLHDQAGLYQPQNSQRNLDVIVPTYCGKTERLFVLQNATTMSDTFTIGSSALNLPPGWSYTLDPPGPFVLDPAENVIIKITVHIPCPPVTGGALPVVRALQLFAGSLPTIDVEAIASGKVQGGIELKFSPVVQMQLYMPVIRK